MENLFVNELVATNTVTATDQTAVAGETATDQAVTEVTTTEENVTNTGTAETEEVNGDTAVDTAGTGDVVMDDKYMGGSNDQGMYTETGMNVDPGIPAVKDPLLSSWTFVIGISAAVLFVSVALGVLLAKLRIKKGIELYED